MGPTITPPPSNDEAIGTTAIGEPPAVHPGLDLARTRRSLLAAGIGAAGAFVASALGRPAPVDAANLVLGATNTTTSPTRVHNSAATSGAWGLVGRTTYTGAASASRGVVGISDGQNGVGVVGQANSGTGARGVLGSSTNGTGVLGSSTNAKGVVGNGKTIGVEGTAPASGYGVRGSGGYNGVYGIGGSYGVIGSASGGYGVYGSGETAVYASGGGYGVQAYGSTYGVYGSSSAYGMYGQGGSYGVVGNGAIGVYGTSSTSSGVYGASSHPNAAAVYGTGGQYGVQGANARTAGVRGDSGYVGVWGEGADWGFFSVATRTTGQNYGIMAESLSPAGFAGYFKGNTHIQGTLSKAAGAFRIDHPLDPDRRWLSHSFVESPDMLNVYNGTVVLDASGLATVRLPDYFEALNRDFRYQLTPIGAAAASLHIARKVERNEFRIAGGSPGQEISWQVTGIRKDDYANAHRIEVETAKSKADQGTRAFVPAGSGAKPMQAGPEQPSGAQPEPAKITVVPPQEDVRPQAPAD